MNRLVILMRPFLDSQWIHKRKFLAYRRLSRTIVFGILLLSLLSQTTSNDISNLKEKVNLELFINRNNSRNIANLRNNIISNEPKDEEFHVAYSGYLRSSSSMLTHQNNETSNDDVLHTNHSIVYNKSSNAHRRTKRGVMHLYNMIICATGCNPLSYKGYGCYCGFLGSGYPMDGIDRCCKMHDWCYDATDCPMFVEYFVPYYWKCYRGHKPICAIEHGEWGGSGSCAQRLCECDRSFAECLRRYRCPRHKAVCTSSPMRFIQNIFMNVL